MSDEQTNMMVGTVMVDYSIAISVAKASMKFAN